MTSWWVSFSHKISYQLCYLKNYLEFTKIFLDFNYNWRGLSKVYEGFHYVTPNSHVTNAPSSMSYLRKSDIHNTGRYNFEKLLQTISFTLYNVLIEGCLSELPPSDSAWNSSQVTTKPRRYEYCSRVFNNQLWTFSHNT